MALSNGKGYSNTPLIFLNPRNSKLVDGKDVKVDPHFEISRVGADNKIAKTNETCTEVSGDLIKLELKDREYNGKVTKHAILLIKDGADTYYLDLTYRIATRSLFNALLSLPNPKGISIGYYENKKGFEAFSVRQNDVVVKWKYEIADLPKADVIKDKKGEVVKTDYSEVDAFFEDNLRELSESFFGPAKAAETAAPAAASKAAAPVASAEDDGQVPF